MLPCAVVFCGAKTNLFQYRIAESALVYAAEKKNVRLNIYARATGIRVRKEWLALAIVVKFL